MSFLLSLCIYFHLFVVSSHFCGWDPSLAWMGGRPDEHDVINTCTSRRRKPKITRVACTPPSSIPCEQKIILVHTGSFTFVLSSLITSRRKMYKRLISSCQTNKQTFNINCFKFKSNNTQHE